MTRTTADRQRRRDDLVGAASRVFARTGVSGASVAEIVREAGVAQGTFYLYFPSKNDVVLAVVERVADQMMAAIGSALERPEESAPDQLRALCAALAAMAEDPSARQLAEFIHRPENQALHDRLAERLLPQLVPVVQGIVVHGVSEGSFDVPDVTTAAWFVVGGLRGLELAGTPPQDMPAAIESTSRLALRALGYRALR